MGAPACRLPKRRRRSLLQPRPAGVAPLLILPLLLITASRGATDGGWLEEDLVSWNTPGMAISVRPTPTPRAIG
jgi:hypothetical protein